MVASVANILYSWAIIFSSQETENLAYINYKKQMV